jgi:dihydrofolate reductase
MRNLVVGAFVTLDGVYQAPGGPNEDRDGGFPHGGWLVPYFDEMFGEIMTAWTKRADAFLLGRKTYEMFAASVSPAISHTSLPNALPAPGRGVRHTGHDDASAEERLFLDACALEGTSDSAV